MTGTLFTIGSYVFWMVGKKKISGQVLDVYKQNSATTRCDTRNSSGAQFLLIQTTEGKVVTRLESDVEGA
jgi:hypothetical protein